MTAQALPFDSPESFTEKVAALLRSRPNTWIDGLEIAKVGGCYAYRTRLSNCRKQFGMVIENRVRKLDGSKVRVSEYRLVTSTEQA